MLVLVKEKNEFFHASLFFFVFIYPTEHIMASLSLLLG